MTLSEYFTNLAEDRKAYMDSLPKRSQLGETTNNTPYLWRQKYVEQTPKVIEEPVNNPDETGIGYTTSEDILEFLKQTNSRNNYETKIVDSGDLSTKQVLPITYIGDSLEKVSHTIYKLNEDNIKNTGLLMDGLSGVGFVNPPDQAGVSGFMGIPNKGKPLLDKEKEALRRHKLRTYWQMQSTSSGQGHHRVYKTATLSPDYRDRLNARLRGVNNIEEKTFSTGFGLSPAEYTELMTNDNIFGQEINPNGGSIYCETNQVLYGSEAKIDKIVESGRINFKKDSSDAAAIYNYNSMASMINLPVVRAKAILNVSSFFCGPMRTPFYREQFVNLGNEITAVNTYTDIARKDGSYFNFKFINNPEESVKKIFNWKSDQFGDSEKTPIKALLSRFPDFSENLYSVLMVKSDLGVRANLMVDDVSVERGYLKDFYGISEDSFMTRINSIQLKMPSLKNNSIHFLSRSVPMIENSINMTHTASLSVRLDECMSIIKSIYDKSGLTFRPADGKNTIASANRLLRTGRIPPIDLIVHYELLSGLMPVANFDDPSSPYRSNLIFKQRDKERGFYSRLFIFEKVKFLGIDSSVDLEKDGEIIEVSIPFTFLRITENINGHKMGRKPKSAGV